MGRLGPSGLPPPRALLYGSGTSGSRAMAPEWSRDTAAGVCDLARCAQAPGFRRETQRWVWEAESVLPVHTVSDTGGVTLRSCAPLLTLVSGLIILLSFLSLGHSDPWASGHLAPWRHSPEAQVTTVKLLPEVRS